jgi:hypothetical protein
LKVSQDFRSRVGLDGSARTGPSIKNRWNQTLRREAHEFIAICDGTEVFNPTGMTNEDRMAMAIRRYRRIDVHEKRKSGQIPFIGAHLACKDGPKFTSRFYSSARPPRNSDPSTPSLAIDACGNPKSDGLRREMDLQSSPLQRLILLRPPRKKKVRLLARPIVRENRAGHGGHKQSQEIRPASEPFTTGLTPTWSREAREFQENSCRSRLKYFEAS